MNVASTTAVSFGDRELQQCPSLRGTLVDVNKSLSDTLLRTCFRSEALGNRCSDCIDVCFIESRTSPLCLYDVGLWNCNWPGFPNEYVIARHQLLWEFLLWEASSLLSGEWYRHRLVCVATNWAFCDSNVLRRDYINRKAPAAFTASDEQCAKCFVKM